MSYLCLQAGCNKLIILLLMISLNQAFINLRFVSHTDLTVTMSLPEKGPGFLERTVHT
jgi:hypothetical protein